MASCCDESQAAIGCSSLDRCGGKLVMLQAINAPIAHPAPRCDKAQDVALAVIATTPPKGSPSSQVFSQQAGGQWCIPCAGQAAAICCSPPSLRFVMVAACSHRQAPLLQVASGRWDLRVNSPLLPSGCSHLLQPTKSQICHDGCLLSQADPMDAGCIRQVEVGNEFSTPPVRPQLAVAARQMSG